MTYTIRINDNSAKAKSIINMLKSLKEDFNFIEIEKEKDTISVQQEKELDKRYAEFLKNPVGKDWNVLKNEL